MTEETSRIWTDSEGIWRTDRPGTIFGIRWDEIFAISVQKFDLIHSESIVLAVDWEFGEYVEFGDYSNGFEQVVAEIASRFPGVGDRIKAAALEVFPGEALVVWQKQNRFTE